jgi:hypothetical protein
MHQFLHYQQAAEADVIILFFIIAIQYTSKQKEQQIIIHEQFMKAVFA